MRRLSIAAFLVPCSAALAFLLSSCPAAQVQDSSTFIQLVASESGALTYKADLGGSPKDVYMVFGNATENDMGTSVAVKDYMPSGSRFRTFAPAVSQARVDAALRTLPASDSGSKAAVRAASTSPVPNSDAVGLARMFYDHTDAKSAQLAATCRWVSDSGYVDMGNGAKRKLSIWVADAEWSSGGAAGKVNQVMVDALGQKFLGAPGDRGSSIYSWVTNMIGAEWGNPGYSHLIAEDDCITILLYDLGGDKSPDSGVMGFFYAVNNWKPEWAQYDLSGEVSNGRIMFCLDSVMLANGDDDLYSSVASPGDAIWSTDDPMPQEIFSTLAHEFQHMIHFYQKAILRLSGSYSSEPTWADEMCSMMVEDLLADKLGVRGPRGVLPTDYTAGAAGNDQGRLPAFNYYNYYGIAGTWPQSGNEAAIPYSDAYAFGAYLSRDYGGAGFLRRMVQTSLVGQAAVAAAASPESGGADFKTLFQRWSAAVLLSDKTDAPEGFRYNSGSSFDSTIGDVTYKLGSINLWNYSCYAADGTLALAGPMVAPLNAAARKAYGGDPMGLSNTYLLAASQATGKREWTISAPAGSTLTVIAR